MGARHLRMTTLAGSLLVLIVAAAVAAIAIGGSEEPAATSVPVTPATFGLVVEGMSGSGVVDVLGEPTRRTTSLAEGLAWPEPEDTCWYYASADGRREYQICFVADAVKTRGSYPVVPEGGP